MNSELFSNRIFLTDYWCDLYENILNFYNLPVKVLNVLFKGFH
jgi:hypothetical protein